MSKKKEVWEHAQGLMDIYARQLIYFAAQDEGVGDYKLDLKEKGIFIEGVNGNSEVSFTKDTKDILQGEEAILSEISIEEDLGKYIRGRRTVTPKLLIRDQIAGPYPRPMYAWERDIKNGNNLHSFKLTLDLYSNVLYHKNHEFKRVDSLHEDRVIQDSKLPKSLVGVECLTHYGQVIPWIRATESESEEIVEMANLERLVRQIEF